MYITSLFHRQYLTILLQHILLSLTFNNLYITAEYIINPGQNSTITCGLSEPCHIICNDTQICAFSTFNVFNTITIECSGQKSCQNTTIHTTNINTLYALFNGHSAFIHSTFISSSTDKNVTINCNGKYACELSTFYHSAEIVTHMCNAESSCSHSTINNTYNDEFSLICTDTRSCSGLCGATALDICSSRCPVTVTNLSPCPMTDVTIYSNDIYIKCSDTKSCAQTLFNVHDFTSLNTEFSGQFAFTLGQLTATSNKTDAVINTLCMMSDACDQAEFYHYGTPSVYHLCNYSYSCQHSLISTETYSSAIIDCAGTSSCTLSILNAINGVNQRLCNGYDSCGYSQIFIMYVESFTLMATGELSFKDGRLYTRDVTNDITVVCDGTESCETAAFYYNASGTTIHDCNGVQSCFRTNMISFVGATVTCDGTQQFSAPCFRMTIVMPFDFDQFNAFKLNLIGEHVALDPKKFRAMFQIYSLFGASQQNIVCINCNNVYDDIVVIYGLKFNKFCWLSDGCLDDIVSDLEHQPNDIELLLEYKSENEFTGDTFDYSNYIAQKEHAILVLADLPGILPSWGDKIYPPQMKSENSWFSIMIFDTTASGLNVDMRSIENAALTLGSQGRLQGASIYSSSNNFVYNAFSSMMKQEVHINNSNYMQLNGPNAGASTLDIFAGNVINLEIRCIDPFKDCVNVNIHSSINPIIQPVFKNGWVFQCESGYCIEECDGDCYYLFDIYFTTIDQHCSWTVADPGCSFLTFDPTFSPSNAPSFPPTNAPTFSPTISPSNSPSQPPTAAPTRFPTIQNAYSKQLNIHYVFSQINEHTIDIIVNSLEIVIEMIERAYIIIATQNYHSDLQYKHFEIIINDDFIRKNELVISTNVHVEDKENLINLVTITSKFTNYTQTQFRQYYNESNLLFTATIVETPNVSESFDYMLPALISIMCIGVFISIAAFMYNKSSKSTVDDAIHIAVMMYALQICDFMSDCNLSIEILSQFSKNTNDFKIPLYIAGYGSVFFIILPYAINVILTCRIQKYVRNNSSAVVYFEQRSAFFVILVILCGGTYAAISLVSSRLFGYEILNCGLTQFELRQLSNLKLFGNVLLENVPQLICQIIYIGYLGTSTNNTTLSFFASSMSIIAALLTWCIERRSSESFVIQYDLEMIKKYKNIMSESQRQSILKKKECKKSLRRLITSSLKIPDTAIELGYVTVTANGCIVHCVHYTYKAELKTVIKNENILSDRTIRKMTTYDLDDENDHDEYIYILAAKRFIKQIYKVRKREVNNAFIKHFDFTNGSFDVNYIEKFGLNNLISKKKLFNSKPNLLLFDTLPENTPNINNSDSTSDGYQKLQSVDFKYQKIVSLGIIIKDLIRNDMSYQYMKQQLSDEKGYNENVINTWLKWYKFEDINGDCKYNEGDGYNDDDDDDEKKYDEGDKHTNHHIQNDEIEIEMQTVMKHIKGNEKKYDDGEQIMTTQFSISLKSQNKSDSYGPKYTKQQSTKL